MELQMLLCVYRGPDTVINEAYNAVNQTSVAANEPVREILIQS